jgi:Ser/Thr protein kinase RdoA (MazF antagonist)
MERNGLSDVNSQAEGVVQWRRGVIAAQSELMRQLSEHYDIQTIVPIEGPFWNAAFRATGHEGPYFIKILNEQTVGTNRSLKDVELIAGTMESLHDQGCCFVPRPRRSFTGKAAVRCGPYLAMAFEWFEGQPAGLPETGPQSLGTIFAAAPVLARLHTAGQSVAASIEGLVTRELPNAYTPAQWARHQDALWINADRRLRERGSSKETLRLVRAANARCEELIANHSSFFREVPEATVLHGDFRPENLIVRRVGIGVVDFDLVHAGPAEVDVAYASLSFSGPRWLMGHRDLGRCEAFVNAYTSADGGGEIQIPLLITAFQYVVLKALSLSFKPEQFEGRLALHREVRAMCESVMGRLK